MGSLRISCFLTEGLFGYSRLPTFIFSKVAGLAFSPNLSKFITFAAAPVVLTPFVRNQGVRRILGTIEKTPAFHLHFIRKFTSQVSRFIRKCTQSTLLPNPLLLTYQVFGLILSTNKHKLDV